MNTNHKSIPHAAAARAGALRVTYDPQVDASYVYFVGDAHRDRPVRQVPAVDGVSFDLDASGRIVGVEVLDATRLLRPETIEQAEGAPVPAPVEALLEPLDLLVLAATRGDAEALESLAAEAELLVLREARRALGRRHEQDAEDVAQDFWLALAERSLVFPLIRGAAQAWIEEDGAAARRSASAARRRLAMSPHQLLTDRQVANTICGTLLANGIPKQDVEDALQEVYIRALRFFRLHEAPKDLYGMKAFCATVARNYAIDQHRKAGRRQADLAAKCKREEYGWVEHEPVTRDPVDADRQLEVLADLFRDGQMPEHGVDILEGVISGCTYGQIAQELGLNDELVRWRLREMQRIYRSRMAKLGMLPGMKPLRVIVSNPSAIPLLRRAA